MVGGCVGVCVCVRARVHARVILLVSFCRSSFDISGIEPRGLLPNGRW